MEDKVLFSTSFNGFNKQDVLNYIENTVDEYENKLKTVKEELKGAKSALEAKNHLYEGLLKKQQELGTPEELTEKIENLNAALLQYQQKYDQKQLDYSQLEQRYNTLLLKSQETSGANEQSNDELNKKLAQMEEELSEYRSQKQNIGSVLLRAQRDADELIFNTKKRCDQEVLKAQKYISDVKRLFEKYNDQIKVEKEQIVHSTTKINSELENVFDYINNAQDAFDDMIGFLKGPQASENE